MNTTDVEALPAHPSLEQYKKQAKDLVKACKADDSEAIHRIRKYHPRHQKPRNAVEAARVRSGQLLDFEVESAKFTLADAQLVIAREHGFESWPKFAKHLQGLTRKDSGDVQFESAADAIVSGDIATLARLLRENPTLIRARSTRAHRATLLHYVSANGFENYRQKSPKNAVEVAKLLLDSGAEVDAIADMYGKDATLGLIATSVHPAQAGVQIPLLDLLLERGAAIDGPPGTGSPLNAALFNGQPKAAEFLAARGAQIDMVGAAGLGRLDRVKNFFNQDGSLRAHARREGLNSGFVLACTYGRTAVVEFLLDRGADLRARENVGQTGLHSAVINGDLNLIKLLLKRGAPLEARNVWRGTVLGQATWCARHSDRNIDYAPVIQTLLVAGANVSQADYPTGIEQVDAMLRQHGVKS
ncbi:MAG TPA: ankyrin repeat domain-containing protein [Bryobacteraceae bacterium]|nr:ankyrin repeat domain-containing protein [Bryobacteraceae bacterium]